ncbi:hypothetical protein BN2475_590051 [Paraburkholderia ribeironis]|uniref:Uncharacterized protein n=1 Tax=Paraburkholderia ribeironis TaxID=1247936 RepID=A0A1N7SEJ8_9BURK|nr:hypothetical protein BN2475_590051 [Paraburkholderia ribeironis]
MATAITTVIATGSMTSGCAIIRTTAIRAVTTIIVSTTIDARDYAAQRGVKSTKLDKEVNKAGPSSRKTGFVTFGLAIGRAALCLHAFVGGSGRAVWTGR